MNQTLRILLKLNEGRTLDAAQRQRFAAYYEALPGRIALMRRLERGEAEVIQGTLGYLQGRFPLEGPLTLLTEVEDQLIYQYRAAVNALLQDDFASLAHKAGFSASLCAQMGLPAGYREAAADKLIERVAHLLGPDWSDAEPFFRALTPARMADWQVWEQVTPALARACSDQDENKPPHEGMLYESLRRLLTASGLACLSQQGRILDEISTFVSASWHQAGLESAALARAWRAVPEQAALLLPPASLDRMTPWLERPAFAEVL